MYFYMQLYLCAAHSELKNNCGLHLSGRGWKQTGLFPPEMLCPGAVVQKQKWENQNELYQGHVVCLLGRAATIDYFLNSLDCPLFSWTQFDYWFFLTHTKNNKNVKETHLKMTGNQLAILGWAATKTLKSKKRGKKIYPIAETTFRISGIWKWTFSSEIIVNKHLLFQTTEVDESLNRCCAFVRYVSDALMLRSELFQTLAALHCSESERHYSCNHGALRANQATHFCLNLNLAVLRRGPG